MYKRQVNEGEDFEISDSYEIEENPEIIDSVSHQSDSQIETISEGEEEGEES